MNIRLSKVRNIRDFSEYGCGDCIRSAHLNAATPADMAVLTERYHLRTIIDLRTTREVQEKPDAAVPGVEHIHIPIFDQAVPGVSHERETDEGRRPMPDMTQFYAALVTEPDYVAQLQKALTAIEAARQKGAVLWHCTEGKDRCGLVSALFLLSHGVRPEAVMEDYLKTNRVNRRKAWKFYFLICLSKRDPAFAAQVRDAFLAKRAYLAPVMERLTQLARAPEGIK